jgi:hypothetical protein
MRVREGNVEKAIDEYCPLTKYSRAQGALWPLDMATSLDDDAEQPS